MPCSDLLQMNVSGVAVVSLLFLAVELMWAKHRASYVNYIKKVIIIILKIISNRVMLLSGDWCKDEEKCSKMKKIDCTNDWMQLNCPKRCGICGGMSTVSNCQ